MSIKSHFSRCSQDYHSMKLKFQGAWIDTNKCWHAERSLDTAQWNSHFPCKYLQIFWFFLARSRKISVEVTGSRRHCKQLCVGKEISCRLVFSCLSKVEINPLKELSENKNRKWMFQDISGLGATMSSWKRQWSTTCFQLVICLFSGQHLNKCCMNIN